MAYTERLQQKMIRKHILRAQEHFRNDILERENQQIS